VSRSIETKRVAMGFRRARCPLVQSSEQKSFPKSDRLLDNGEVGRTVATHSDFGSYKTKKCSCGVQMNDFRLRVRITEFFRGSEAQAQADGTVAHEDGHVAAYKKKWDEIASGAWGIYGKCVPNTHPSCVGKRPEYEPQRALRLQLYGSLAPSRSFPPLVCLTSDFHILTVLASPGRGGA